MLFRSTAHGLTADQLDFIVMHELGHVALNHPRRLAVEQAEGRDMTALRHEFEYGADAFALGLMRSRFVRAVHATANASSDEEKLSFDERTIDWLHDYQRKLGAVYLLFSYMDFIQRAGELLRDRLGERIHMNPRMDSHPRAGQRLEQLELMNLGEYLYTSPLQRYTRDFLQSLLDYATAMDDDTLLASVAAITD